jgi:hypothetical protein
MALAKELAALETKRPYSILDTKPQLERPGEAQERASVSVGLEVTALRRCTWSEDHVDGVHNRPSLPLLVGGLSL